MESLNSLNIYALLMMIRGFSNEVTVQGLASKLGISYSTLARCKSGVWPRSITRDAMRSVLDDCRLRFFGGDGLSLGRSALRQLEEFGIACQPLADVLEQKGYEAFVSALISMAAAASTRASTSGKSDAPSDEPTPLASGAAAPPAAAALPPDLPAQSETGDRAPSSAAVVSRAPGMPEAVTLAGPPAETTSLQPAKAFGSLAAPELLPERQGIPRVVRDILLVAPFVVILLVGLLNFSLTGFLLWAVDNPAPFLAISLSIAIAPALIGVCVDAPLAWRAYQRTHAKVPLTPAAFAHVARYGAVEGMEPGAGRFNLSRAYLSYQPVCNVLGALCYFSLLMFLAGQPGFGRFLAGHEFVEFFKVGIAVAFFIAYGHLFDQLRGGSRAVAPSFEENPDNVLPTRAHVWANSIHLVWTLSLCIVLLMAMVAYALVYFRQYPAPTPIIWPYLLSMAFLAFSCMSPYAVRVRSRSVGTFLPGVLIVSGSVLLMTCVCYLPTMGTLVICGLCIACSLAAFAWSRSWANRQEGDWLQEGEGAAVYSYAIFVTVMGLVAIGMLTSAFA